ncbi:MAG: hypothetical protein DMG64_04700 [Acidobacteria bacterium]|nr:MAG: hypothetical protein DMG64_04700 [Acidobacteriota bacterium]PYY24329.1 MAG: hypothetical protein DMG62_03295 [Acidobacteriota bacterium]
MFTKQDHFRMADDSGTPQNGCDQIATALGGDTIEGRAGIIYRNHERLWEPYVIHTLGSATPFPYTFDFGPITLAPGQMFVMADNRDVSYHSRQPKHGPVSLSTESGKPLYFVWSPDHRRIGRAVR